VLEFSVLPHSRSCFAYGEGCVAFCWQVQTCESFTVAANVSFYMQYFHNLTHNNSDTFRILLQKRKKRSFLNKVIAESPPTRP